MAAWERAQAAFASGQWIVAKSAYEAVLSAEPRHAAALVQLSYVECQVGSARRARELALAALRTNPTSPKLLADLFARLRTFNECVELRDLVRRLRPDQLPIPLLLVIASQLSYLGLQDEAMVYLDEAYRADPAYPPTLLARAQVSTYLGRFDAALADLKACLSTAPELPRLYWLWSRLRTATPGDHNVERIRRLQMSRRPAGEGAAELAFALHKELHDLGEWSEAWLALEQGCRYKRELVRFDPSESRQLFADLVASDLDLPGGPGVSVGSGLPIPVFIVGMHRSGTSLLEHLMARQLKVAGLGELYDFTAAMRQATDHHCRGVLDRKLVARSPSVDFQALGQTYLRGLAWRLGSDPVFTDKLPSNFLNLGFILRALPQARILHVVRDARDTCFSSLRELFSDANPFSYDQLELADYYRNYDMLMSHWHSRYSDRIIKVEYARLTTDPNSVVDEVARFCGAEQRAKTSAETARPVATASAVQVRNEVRKREVPLWAPYADKLKPLFAALGECGDLQ